MSLKPKLEAMTDPELRAEYKRLLIMLEDDESYLQDIAGRRWCFERLKQIEELLPGVGFDLAADNFEYQPAPD